MAEYISREAVLQKFLERGNGYINMLTIKTMIDEIPAADVQFIKHGRWIIKGQEIYCSECDTESSYNSYGASQFTRFCPNCGARMDLKDGDTE